MPRFVTIKDGLVIADVDFPSTPDAAEGCTVVRIPAEHVDVRLLGASADTVAELIAPPAPAEPEPEPEQPAPVIESEIDKPKRGKKG